MQLEVNSALNLVFPMRFAEKVDPKDDRDVPDSEKRTIVEPTLWAYHAPVSYDFFRAHYRVFASAKDLAIERGLQTALAVADMTLLDAAKSDAERHNTIDAGPMILAELRRLTLILAPGQTELLPLDVAVKRNAITADECHDAECVIAFFTSASMAVMRSMRPVVSASLASILKGSMTSLTVTDYAASLAISTAVPISAVPIPS